MLNQVSYGEKTNNLIDQLDEVNLNVEHLGEEISGIDETVHILDENIENLNGSLNAFNNDLGNISNNLSLLVKGYSRELVIACSVEFVRFLILEMKNRSNPVQMKA